MADDTIRPFDQVPLLYGVSIVDLTETAPPITFAGTLTFEARTATFGAATLPTTLTFSGYGDIVYEEVIDPVSISSAYVINPDKGSNIGPFWDRTIGQYIVVLYHTATDSAQVFTTLDRAGTWTAQGSAIPLYGGRYGCCQGEGDYEGVLYIAYQTRNVGGGSYDLGMGRWDGASLTLVQLDTGLGVGNVSVSLAPRWNAIDSKWEMVLAYSEEFFEASLGQNRFRVYAAIYDCTTNTASLLHQLDWGQSSPDHNWFHGSLVPNVDFTKTHYTYQTGPDDPTYPNSIWFNTLDSDDTLGLATPIVITGVTDPTLVNDDALKPMGQGTMFYDGTKARYRWLVVATDGATYEYLLQITGFDNGSGFIKMADLPSGTSTDYLMVISHSATYDPNEAGGNYETIGFPAYPAGFDYAESDLNFIVWSSSSAGLMMDETTGDGDNTTGNVVIDGAAGITDGMGVDVMYLGGQYVLGYVYQKSGAVYYDELLISPTGAVDYNGVANWIVTAGMDVAKPGQKLTTTVAMPASASSTVGGFGYTYTPWDVAPKGEVLYRGTAVVTAKSTNTLRASATLEASASFIASMGRPLTGTLRPIKSTANMVLANTYVKVERQRHLVHICVTRNGGGMEGEVVVDELISNDAVALSRGRSELDASQMAQRSLTVDIPYMTGLRLGQLVKVTDILQGVVHDGKIVGISHSAVPDKGTGGLTKVELALPEQP